MAGSVIDPAVKPTLLFDATGNASGNGGCNTFNGSYTVDGATIAFGPMISTKMACVGPGDLVESAYLDALQAATGWSIGSDGNLTLTGDVPLVFSAA